MRPNIIFTVLLCCSVTVFYGQQDTTVINFGGEEVSSSFNATPQNNIIAGQRWRQQLGNFDRFLVAVPNQFSSNNITSIGVKPYESLPTADIVADIPALWKYLHGEAYKQAPPVLKERWAMVPELVDSWNANYPPVRRHIPGSGRNLRFQLPPPDSVPIPSLNQALVAQQLSRSQLYRTIETEPNRIELSNGIDISFTLERLERSYADQARMVAYDALELLHQQVEAAISARHRAHAPTRDSLLQQYERALQSGRVNEMKASLEVYAAALPTAPDEDRWRDSILSRIQLDSLAKQAELLPTIDSISRLPKATVVGMSNGGEMLMLNLRQFELVWEELQTIAMDSTILASFEIKFAGLKGIANVLKAHQMRVDTFYSRSQGTSGEAEKLLINWYQDRQASLLDMHTKASRNFEQLTHYTDLLALADQLRIADAYTKWQPNLKDAKRHLAAIRVECLSHVRSLEAEYYHQQKNFHDDD